MSLIYTKIASYHRMPNNIDQDPLQSVKTTRIHFHHNILVHRLIAKTPDVNHHRALGSLVIQQPSLDVRMPQQQVVHTPLPASSRRSNYRSQGTFSSYNGDRLCFNTNGSLNKKEWEGPSRCRCRSHCRGGLTHTIHPHPAQPFKRSCRAPSQHPPPASQPQQPRRSSSPPGVSA